MRPRLPHSIGPLALTALLTLTACPTTSTDPTPEPTPAPVDTDGDGIADEDDCAPDDATVFPGAEELCDGVDNDCDGVVPADEADEDLDQARPCEGDCDDHDSFLSNRDFDMDGQSNCEGDCDDYDATVEDLDSDGDGESLCDGDCDDADPTRFFGNSESDDCDGVDEDCVIDLRELDRDGDGYRPCEGDCADLNDQAFPGHPEVCDVVDNDCNGVKDDGLVIAPPWPADGEFDASLAVARLYPEEPGDTLGQSIAAGDVNGDGYGDLIIASNNDDNSQRNAVYLIHGPFCGEATVGDPAEGVVAWRLQAAQSTSTVGDINNDGYADVRRWSGVHFGPLSGEGDLADVDWGLSSWGPNHWGEFALLNVGDLNGDGVDDIAVGEDGAPWTWNPDLGHWDFGQGRVSLFWGPLGPAVVTTEDADAVITVDPTSDGPQNQWFGTTFTGGDFDGDGHRDLAISSRGPSRATYIAYGPITDGEHNLDDDPSTTRIQGWAQGLVATDLDGDGADELGISGLADVGVYWVGVFGGPIAPGSTLLASDAGWGEYPSLVGGVIGATRLGETSCLVVPANDLEGLSGLGSHLFCAQTLPPPHAGAFADEGVFVVGDLNGDLRPDMLFGDSGSLRIILAPSGWP